MVNRLMNLDLITPSKVSKYIFSDFTNNKSGQVKQPLCNKPSSQNNVCEMVLHTISAMFFVCFGHVSICVHGLRPVK